MSSNRFIKFWPVTITFLIGLVTFFIFQSSLHLSFWYLIIWIKLFAIIQFCGAYFIGLNFHLSSVNSLNTNSKTVLLTFDDGPNANTAKVLEVLKKYHVKAVFFVIGKNIAGNERIMQQIVAEGHQIGNHSFSHHNFIDLWSTKKVTEDLASCQKLIEYYQPTSKLFRPPYGVTNPNIARAVKTLGLQPVGWNVRSYDTSIKDVEKIKQRVLSQLKPGAIILLHDRLDFMPELLETLIPAVKEKGYGFTGRLANAGV
ncbi:MAG: polysaccharide deacetylase family protein [Bacteroidetes bacterium]|nr:polysaccharide deacetylase family protein [Bacteroidota bacterium]